MELRPLLLLVLIAIVDVRGSEFVWTRSAVNYLSSDRQLSGSVTATYYNAYLVTQCAYRCLQTTPDQCASYNFIPLQRKCELNSASHVTQSDNLLPVEGSQYYLRDAFSIDSVALGPCANSPCNNQGICLTMTSSDGTLTLKCVCRDGWSGNTCNVPEPVPVWDTWSDWTQCSTSCGNGMKSRHRQCIDKMSGQTVSSQLCYGREQELALCHVSDCPGWSEYSAWSQCSTDTLCGPGQQVRTHTCANGGVPGVDRMCMGPTIQTTLCQSPSCDTPLRLVGGLTYGEGRVNIYDDVMSTWLPVCAKLWTKSNADVVCRQLGFNSGSIQSQVLNFGNEPAASAAISNVSCQGNEASLATCTHATWHDASCASGPHAAVQCIVDGRWSTWSNWSDCSVTCADGVLTRHRACDSPAPQRGGADCQESSIETKPCTAAPCPVDAYWSSWGTWSACSKSCGGGDQTRSRVCHLALYGGSQCAGSASDTQSCNTQLCPVDGTWQTWSDWGMCNATCGGGWKIRTRQCQQPLYGGANCVGPSFDSTTCNTQNCPIDGVWNEWSPWSSCNATCGSGTRLRVRSCVGPFYGGADCPGASQQTQFCNDNPCPVDGQWSAWSRWLDCPVTCGGGTQRRYRECYGAVNGGNACPGSTDEYQDCGTNPCPVNCTWQAWSNWAGCSVTCGGGTQIRTRSKTPAQYGGLDCTGNAQENMTCNTNSCYTPGLWLAFSDWSLCSATCGTSGMRTRTRVCNMTSYGSLTGPCLPTNGTAETDSKSCNKFSCTPSATSCQELFTRGLEDSSSFVKIDLDGETGSQQPIGVECQRNGTVIYTLVHTMQETTTKVQGYEAIGEYKSAVQYVDKTGAAITVPQIIALVDRSGYCSQYISWRCYAAAINSPSTTTSSSYYITYWQNRYNKTMTYWGGARAPQTNDGSTTVTCSCGEASSCFKANTKCNCDAEDNAWRVDDGYITNKIDLPISTFNAGDTGAPGSTGKSGFYMIGPLICN